MLTSPQSPDSMIPRGGSADYSQSSTAGVLNGWSFTATPKLRLHHVKVRFTTRR